MRSACQAECKYRCMHATERARAGAAAVKYYGKWPFQRALGMQVCRRLLRGALRGVRLFFDG